MGKRSQMMEEIIIIIGKHLHNLLKLSLCLCKGYVFDEVIGVNWFN